MGPGNAGSVLPSPGIQFCGGKGRRNRFVNIHKLDINVYLARDRIVVQFPDYGVHYFPGQLCRGNHNSRSCKWTFSWIKSSEQLQRVLPNSVILQRNPVYSGRGGQSGCSPEPPICQSYMAAAKFMESSQHVYYHNVGKHVILHSAVKRDNNYGRINSDNFGRRYPSSIVQYLCRQDVHLHGKYNVLRNRDDNGINYILSYREPFNHIINLNGQR